MSKIALGAALAMLLLAGCGSPEPESARNDADRADGAEANGLEAVNVSAPEQPAAVNQAGEPVSPPDAVSHPDGYLPPDPATVNLSGPEVSPPVTEDQHVRNGQSGR